MMKKLCLLSLALILLFACSEEQKEQIHHNLTIQKHPIDTIQDSSLGSTRYRPCDCNGGVYFPTSSELISYD